MVDELERFFLFVFSPFSKEQLFCRLSVYITSLLVPGQVSLFSTRPCLVLSCLSLARKSFPPSLELFDIVVEAVRRKG